jgi:pimeloyl-ACP methyl ester carboxylesterase
MRFARPALVRFLGVPPAVEAAAPQPERERVGAILRSLLPLSRRVAGLRVDGAAAIVEWPLERIRTPSLVVSAEDDLFRTLPAARHTAARIPGAELVVLPEGGHLMVGQGERVRAAIADFLARNASDLQPG